MITTTNHGSTVPMPEPVLEPEMRDGSDWIYPCQTSIGLVEVRTRYKLTHEELKHAAAFEVTRLTDRESEYS